MRLVKKVQEIEREDRQILVIIYEHQGKKFKFIFNNSNGDPLGFDYKHCIKVFNMNDDEWKNLADKSEIMAYMKSGHTCDFNYYCGSLEKANAYEFMAACQEYVVMLYGE